MSIMKKLKSRYQTRIYRILRDEMLRETAPTYGRGHHEEDEHET
jgi:hypothetical protein